jgi:protein-tyrosine phosphatase
LSCTSTDSEANIFPIPIPVAGSLAIVPRPRGGDWLDDDVRRLIDHGTQVLVSLLCDSECVELGLEEEAAACTGHHIGFISLPVPDLGAPVDTGEFIETVHRLATLIRGGTSVAVHCRQSVGRSGLLAASVAMACGMPLQVALETISKARGVAVPETQVQRDWLQRIEPRLSNPER